MYKNKYKKKNLNVMSVNTLVLILAIIFLTIGFDIQKKDLFRGTFINEFIMIFLPAIIFASTGKFFDILKLKKPRPVDIVFSILIVILAYPVILLLNGLFLSSLSKFIEFKNFSMEIFLRNMPILNYLLFMCLVPAICEELFFRSVLINSYEVYGTKFAIIMSAFVFALFHFDIQNFVAPLLLGILFGNILEKTGSIICAMTAHITNNIIAVFSSRYLNERVFEYLKNTNISRQIGSYQLFTIILLITLSAISVFFMRILFKKMKRKRDYVVRYRDVEGIDIFNFVPIIALVILYLIYYYIVY